MNTILFQVGQVCIVGSRFPSSSCLCVFRTVTMDVQFIRRVYDQHRRTLYTQQSGVSEKKWRLVTEANRGRCKRYPDMS